jgi:hypothetical protein
MGYHLRIAPKIAVLLIALTTAGCSYPEIRSRVEGELSRADIPTPTPVVSIQITRTACPWNWAYQPAPEAPAYFHKLFQVEGINATNISAQAFGETGGPDCSFHRMEYDLTSLSISDPTVTDEEGLGKLALKVVTVLNGKVGRVKMMIEGKGVSVQTSFLESQAYALVDQKLDGKAFLDALKKMSR